jgi:hypothetical protein
MFSLPQISLPIDNSIRHRCVLCGARRTTDYLQPVTIRSMFVWACANERQDTDRKAKYYSNRNCASKLHSLEIALDNIPLADFLVMDDLTKRHVRRSR